MPHRITSNLHNITDDIITNDPKLLFPGVIQTAVSDQYLVFFLTLNYSISKSNPESFFHRDNVHLILRFFVLNGNRIFSYFLGFANANKNNVNQLFFRVSLDNRK